MSVGIDLSEGVCEDLRHVEFKVGTSDLPRPAETETRRSCPRIGGISDINSSPLILP